MSVVFADVDHFKAFNDSFGHAAGDECLRRVARAIADVLSRPSDVVARYGGDEFAALLPGTDRAGAGVIARRLRQRIAALAIRHPSGSARGMVTVSIGVATAPLPAADLEPHAILRAADRLLYVAKQCGRDRSAHGDLRAEDSFSDVEEATAPSRIRASDPDAFSTTEGYTGTGRPRQ